MLVIIIFAVILFILLTPGVLLKIPNKKSILIVSIVHSIIFVVLFYIVILIYSRYNNKNIENFDYTRPKVGERVNVNWKDKGACYPGKISKSRSNCNFDIKYDDGDKEYNINEDRIKFCEVDYTHLKVGEHVNVNWKDKGACYPGKISKSRSNGNFDIKYDDGDKEYNINEDRIKFCEIN
jgi:hypothetical protein